MKTFKNHTILFDAECSMCRAISKGLVKSGLSSEDGSVAYQEFPEMACPMLDRQRAANEIALVNNDTGEVSYGVEGLFSLIANAYPGLRPLLSFPPFIWLMSKIYSFFAFNRRVIVPPAEGSDRSAIQPSFRLAYRLLYLILTWLVASSVLTAYSRLTHIFLPSEISYPVPVILAGLLFFQGVLLYVIERRKVWDYLGNMMTVMTVGSVLLLPVLLLARWIGPAPLFISLYLGVVVLLMLRMHLNRSKELGLGVLPTITGILILASFFLFYR